MPLLCTVVPDDTVGNDTTNIFQDMYYKIIDILGN